MESRKGEKLYPLLDVQGSSNVLYTAWQELQVKHKFTIE